MGKIIIGKSGHQNIGIDLQTLLSTRLLIQADSGGGKTYLLRVICEEAWGKIQVIIIDPEGEFATLREKFGYVLVGKDGDTPADPRSAALLATRLLELRASAICDLYEMKPQQRHEWVQKFLDSMVDAPKNLWHPVLVIVDEAHMFCPEKGMGESEALDSMIALCTRGRKRGFCPVFATQRLSNLSKSASGMLLNRLIGPTFESGNITRAADELAIPKKQAERQDFIQSVKLLEPGNYYALGRAIARELTLVKVNKVQTTHLEVGAKYSAPPPPPENVAKLLPKLSDLPKEAEDKARTESELRAENRTLKQQLRAANGSAALGKGLIATRLTVGESTIRATISQEIEPWRTFSQQIRREVVECHKLMRATVDFVSDKLARYLNGLETQPLPSYPVVEVDVKAIKAKLESEPKPTEQPFSHTVTSKTNLIGAKDEGSEKYLRGATVGIAVCDEAVLIPKTFWDMVPNGDLTGPERAILSAMAELLSIEKNVPTREEVAGWSGYSVKGSAFKNPVGALKSAGYIRYPTPGTLSLTQSGIALIGTRDTPDQTEIRRRVNEICDGPERKILNAVLAHGREKVTREQIAEESGYSADGSAFKNPVGSLKSKGMLDYPEAGLLQAADWLFL